MINYKNILPSCLVVFALAGCVQAKKAQEPAEAPDVAEDAAVRFTGNVLIGRPSHEFLKEVQRYTGAVLEGDIPLAEMRSRATDQILLKDRFDVFAGMHSLGNSDSGAAYRQAWGVLQQIPCTETEQNWLRISVDAERTEGEALVRELCPN